MKWQYQVIAKLDLEEFIGWLNRLGDDGWEAISGTYTLGEPGRMTLPNGGSIERPGVPQWVAVMKRQKPD